MFARSFQTAFLLSLLTLSLPALAGTIIHVPANQPTIQAGINAASNGDTVLVSPGKYYENINFLGKAIKVTSSGGPTATIIDGSKGSPSPTVTFSTNETTTSVLSGFTIQSGNYIQIYISSSSPTIQGNIIQGLTELTSTGISIQDGSAVIRGNLIIDNYQGGILSSNGTGNTIAGNLIASSAGGGIALNYSNAPDTVQQNTIVENGYVGFNYYNYGNGGMTLVQNLIAGNLGLGVNITANGSPVTMISNTIANNQSPCCGSGPSEVQIDQFNSATTLQNNLIVATAVSPALSCQNSLSTPVLANNDVYAANNSAYTGSCPDPTGTKGNISVDPLFVDSIAQNFHLQSASPAINAGTNSAIGEPKTDFDGDPRTVGSTIDIGADEYASKTALAFSSYDLHFAAQDVGTKSSPQVVTLTNQKTTPVTLNLIAAGGSFSQTNNCGAALAAGASCKINATFSPLGSGAIRGVLGVFTNATLNPLAVNMLGTGLAPQVQFYSSFYFFNQVIGTTSTQTGTLTNVGQAPLTISSIVLNAPSDFSQSNTCPIAPKKLDAGANCTISMTYAPTVVESVSGTLIVNDNAIPSPQIAGVNGTSLSAGLPTLNPTALTFPTTLIGQISAPQTATLTNTGTGPLGILNIYSNNDFPQTNNCPVSLAVGASCTFTVNFMPSSQGNESSFLNINTDSISSYTSLSLAGTGQAPVPAITSLSVASVPAGSADTQFTITGSGFVYGSQVLWNGVALPCCSYESGGTQIFVTIPASNLRAAGTNQLSVFTPTPGGGTSNSLPFSVYAPVNYAAKSTTYNYRAITGTNLNLSFYNVAQITSPFSIQFGGGSFTNLFVSPAGTISFNGFGQESNDVIPTTQTPMLIAPFWTQLYAFGSGNDNNVFWEVTRTAPNRQLVVEWRNVTYCCGNDTVDTVKFQVVFFEGSSNIVFNYADTVFGGPFSGDDNGATATSGIQVAPGLGTQYSYNQPSLHSKTALLWYPGSPTATLSSSTLGLGYHQIGTRSLPQKATLTNGSVATLLISGITLDNPDFTQTNNCGASLASHRSCTIQVYFTPSLPSAETATLKITDNATNSPQTAAVTGVGTITSVVIYPIMANFGSVKVGSTGTLPVVLANASNQPLTIQQITASPTVYTETNTCGASLAAGASCTVSVTFAPTQPGSVAGKLSMGLNGKPVVPEVKLVGSGQ